MRSGSETVYLVEVVVIDDEPKKKSLIKDVLEAQGFKVTWCTNWKEVNELLSLRITECKPFPNVALVDMHFVFENREDALNPSNPALEGLAIVMQLRRTCADYGRNPIPAIGFTAREEYLLRREMVEAGFVDFITAEEWKRPRLFARRVLENIGNTIIESGSLAVSSREIEKIEDQIVGRVLDQTKENIEEAARLLKWPKEYLEKIKVRCQSTGAS